MRLGRGPAVDSLTDAAELVERRRQRLWPAVLGHVSVQLGQLGPPLRQVEDLPDRRYSYIRQRQIQLKVGGQIKEYRWMG